jgi:hypothetical protein
MTEISSITADQFISAVRRRNPDFATHFEELEFYSTLDGWFLGVMCRFISSGLFSFVLFGPDVSGTYHAFDVCYGITAEDDAREQLIAALKLAAAEGRRVVQLPSPQ